jgi:hypothetical protein
MTHNFHPTTLREYDIRGIIGETLGAEDAYAIGRGSRPCWVVRAASALLSAMTGESARRCLKKL